MKDVGNEDGEIRGNTDMKVLERCTPGNSLCGNSCNEVITNLEDKYPRPQDCVVGDWGSWGKCTRECGGGTQTRERKIKYEAKRGGVPCRDKKFDTHLQETQTCNVRPCTNPNFKLTDEATLTGKNGDTIEIVNKTQVNRKSKNTKTSTPKIPRIPQDVQYTKLSRKHQTIKIGSRATGRSLISNPAKSTSSTRGGGSGRGGSGGGSRGGGY